MKGAAGIKEVKWWLRNARGNCVRHSNQYASTFVYKLGHRCMVSVSCWVLQNGLIVRYIDWFYLWSYVYFGKLYFLNLSRSDEIPLELCEPYSSPRYKGVNQHTEFHASIKKHYKTSWRILRKTKNTHQVVLDVALHSYHVSARLDWSRRI